MINPLEELTTRSTVASANVQVFNRDVIRTIGKHYDGELKQVHLWGWVAIGCADVDKAGSVKAKAPVIREKVSKPSVEIICPLRKIGIIVAIDVINTKHGLSGMRAARSKHPDGPSPPTRSRLGYLRK